MKTRNQRLNHEERCTNAGHYFVLVIRKSVVALLLATIIPGYAWVTPAGGASQHAHPRIISLAPNLTEVLFELGAGEELVGVTRFCTYPPAAQKKEKIGDFINPNLEKIVALKPDLILAERWPSSKIVPRLRQIGLNVIETTSPKSVAGIYQLIDEVGTAIGKRDRAQTLIKGMRQRIRAIEARGKSFPRRPLLYIEIDPPSWTVGRNSFINEAVFICGARNIFDDSERPALQVSREVVAERNPEIIVSFDTAASEIRSRPGWSQIKAIREGNIIDGLNRNLLTHGNHRLVEGMEELQRRLEKMVTGTGHRSSVIGQQSSVTIHLFRAFLLRQSRHLMADEY